MASILMPELRQELAGWLTHTTRQWPWIPRLQLTPRDVLIRLEGLHPASSIPVASTDLRVSVDWHGRHLDTLLWLDMVLLRLDGFYVCMPCTQPNPETFESLAAMRHDHLYLPLLRWCRQSLAFASHVEVYQQSGAYTARLVLRRDSDEGTVGTAAPVKPNTRRWPLWKERNWNEAI